MIALPGVDLFAHDLANQVVQPIREAGMRGAAAEAAADVAGELLPSVRVSGGLQYATGPGAV